MRWGRYPIAELTALAASLLVLALSPMVIMELNETNTMPLVFGWGVLAIACMVVEHERHEASNV